MTNKRENLSIILICINFRKSNSKILLKRLNKRLTEFYVKLIRFNCIFIKFYIYQFIFIILLHFISLFGINKLTNLED